jgi:hypothetical protein
LFVPQHLLDAKTALITCAGCRNQKTPASPAVNQHITATRSHRRQTHPHALQSQPEYR